MKSSHVELWRSYNLRQICNHQPNKTADLQGQGQTRSNIKARLRATTREYPSRHRYRYRYVFMSCSTSFALFAEWMTPQPFSRSSLRGLPHPCSDSFRYYLHTPHTKTCVKTRTAPPHHKIPHIPTKPTTSISFCCQLIISALLVRQSLFHVKPQ